MNFRPQHFTIWAEIPVRDLERSVKYYETVLQTKLEVCEEGPNPMATFKTEDESGVAGHLYPGKPAENGSGPTIHLSCDGDLEALCERVRAAGGQVVSDIITIPPGRFFYSTDPDGNSIGFFSKVGVTADAS